MRYVITTVALVAAFAFGWTFGEIPLRQRSWEHF
jgi:hypothetical protein